MTLPSCSTARHAQAREALLLILACRRLRLPHLLGSCTAVLAIGIIFVTPIRSQCSMQSCQHATDMSCCLVTRHCAQMGRGRTTTGMIIATMLLLRKRGSKLHLLPHPQGQACQLRCSWWQKHLSFAHERGHLQAFCPCVAYTTWAPRFGQSSEQRCAHLLPKHRTLPGAADCACACAAGLPSWFVEPAGPLISPRSDEHRLEQELKAGRCCPRACCQACMPVTACRLAWRPAQLEVEQQSPADLASLHQRAP